MNASTTRLGLLLTLSACLSACSNGGPEGEITFGLETRVAASLNFPTSQPKALATSAAFPNLFFSQAILAIAPPDGSDRICIVERTGRIHIFANDPDVSSTTVLLDLFGRVRLNGEFGLLGLAFDPDFATNGFFYVHYSTGSPDRSVIARFTMSADPNVADVDSEAILLEVEQPFSNHNGGMLAFADDGTLFIGFGDGGDGGDPNNHGQNRATLLGSMLRIQPEDDGTYSIPADNPFVGVAGVREEIFAYGLRNPFRFSIDSVTDELWVGDVGQETREEISIVGSGDNLGWRVFEGDAEHNNPDGVPATDFVAPVIDYPRTEGTTVIGGLVYRGSALASLTGAYIYGDYGNGSIWALTRDADGKVESNTLIGRLSRLTSFGVDQSGELLATTLSGEVVRFTETDGGVSDDFPGLLSETGLFDSLADLTATPGLVEFDINTPLWSDGASKRRWIAVPGDGQIQFEAEGAWSFPLGTVLVKHFEIELEVGNPDSVWRLETRVFVHETDGWSGYTYRWNDEQDEAVLLEGAESVVLTIADASVPEGSREQVWNFPSRSQCLSCHTEEAGIVLGPRTLQLNRDFEYETGTDNQLRSWNHIGLFDQELAASTAYDAFPHYDDEDSSEDDRVRAYLDVNCAPCHRAGGSSSLTLDLRWGIPRDEMNVFGVRPSVGKLDLDTARIIRPGVKESSVLWERLRRTDDKRMPPLGSTENDAAVIELIGNWIDNRLWAK